MMKKIEVLMAIILLSCVLTGCLSSRLISEEDAIVMMQEYIQDKYGDVPEITEIKWAQGTLSKNSDTIVSRGYYAKTADSYYIRMNVFEKDDVNFLDTRQYPEVEAALTEYFRDNPISDSYSVKLANVPEDGTPEEIWDVLKNAYGKKWDGDITNLGKLGNLYVFQLESSSGQISFAARAEDRWSLDYDEFEAYFDNASNELGVTVRGIVVCPTIDEQELASTDPYKLWKLDNYYQSVTVSRTDYGPGASVRQQSSISGFEITVVSDSLRAPQYGENEVSLNVEPVNDRLRDEMDRDRYQPVSEVYTLNRAEGDIEYYIVLDIDLTKAARDADVSDGEIVLLRLNSEGDRINSVLKGASLKEIETRSMDSTYQSGSRLAYDFEMTYSQMEHFCIAKAPISTDDTTD